MNCPITSAEEGAVLAQFEAEDRRVEAALKVWHEIHDTANVDDDPEDLDHAAMSFALAEADKHSTAESEVSRLTEMLAKVEAERDEAGALIADYEEAQADKRRLAREIDVAMHGEAGAARQPSLCDLVAPAKALAERVKGLEAENVRLRKFASFALLWCDRGPPHGGSGNEAAALDVIRHHPVLSAMRKEGSHD